MWYRQNVALEGSVFLLVASIFSLLFPARNLRMTQHAHTTASSSGCTPAHPRRAAPSNRGNTSRKANVPPKVRKRKQGRFGHRRGAREGGKGDLATTRRTLRCIRRCHLSRVRALCSLLRRKGRGQREEHERRESLPRGRTDRAEQGMAAARPSLDVPSRSLESLRPQTRDEQVANGREATAAPTHIFEHVTRAKLAEKLRGFVTSTSKGIDHATTVWVASEFAGK